MELMVFRLIFYTFVIVSVMTFGALVWIRLVEGQWPWRKSKGPDSPG